MKENKREEIEGYLDIVSPQTFREEYRRLELADYLTDYTSEIRATSDMVDCLDPIKDDIMFDDSFEDEQIYNFLFNCTKKKVICSECREELDPFEDLNIHQGLLFITSRCICKTCGAMWEFQLNLKSVENVSSAIDGTINEIMNDDDDEE